jgi:hypothetical protein
MLSRRRLGRFFCCLLINEVRDGPVFDGALLFPTCFGRFGADKEGFDPLLMS